MVVYMGIGTQLPIISLITLNKIKFDKLVT